MPALEANPNAIAIPGCRLSPCGLRLDEGLSKEETELVGKTLNTISQCGLWWWGDYLCQVDRRHGEKYTESVLKSGYSYSSLAQAKWVCHHLDFSKRLEKLTFSHHMEALGECDGDALKALEWLTKARDGEWTVAQLRAAIRLDGVVKVENEPKSKAVGGYGEINAFRSWVDSHFATQPHETKVKYIGDLRAILERMEAAL